jgi:hypothetical protein
MLSLNSFGISPPPGMFESTPYNHIEINSLLNIIHSASASASSTVKLQLSSPIASSRTNVKLNNKQQSLTKFREIAKRIEEFDNNLVEIVEKSKGSVPFDVTPPSTDKLVNAFHDEDELLFNMSELDL